MASTTTLPRADTGGKHQRKPRPPKRQKVQPHHKPATPPPAPAAQEAWHKHYGTTVDQNGNEVPNYQSWKRCTCQIGCDHT